MDYRDLLKRFVSAVIESGVTSNDLRAMFNTGGISGEERTELLSIISEILEGHQASDQND